MYRYLIMFLLGLSCLCLTIGAPPKNRALANHKPWAGSIEGTPNPPDLYQVVKAFPKLKFKNPVFIAQEPDTNRIMVGELTGKIYAFPKDRPEPDAMKLFLDIGRELYAFSFHPKYTTNGHIFIFSPRDRKIKAKEQNSRVSRFIATGNPKTCSPKSEKIIIEWLAGGHNGGEAIIGPDGYLYIATGDQTSTSDGNSTGQGVNDLLAVIMRIDVDHPAPGKAYSIPKDNPFVKFPGARPEVWAFGFRNPWRMSFDEPTGQLWVGDVGQDIWEMIRLVKKGGNYGWSVQEGSHSFHPHKKAGPGPILPPIVEHHHSECRSITGGYVYRGKKFPELNGVYLYGDYEYGIIWGLRYDPTQKKTQKPVKGNSGHIIHSEHVVWHKQLADTSLRIASFGVSRDGDIYLVDHPSGEIYRLEKAAKAKEQKPFPKTLSETGLFKSVKNHEMANGVIPYSVNVPQWLDGAKAERFLALPKDVKIKRPNADVRAWDFDDGAVTVQTISMEMEAGNPKSKHRIETRIMVKQQNHWLGYSYLWNKEQTGAELAHALGQDVVLTIKDPNAKGGQRRHTWSIPSRNECMFCHSRAAGFVLGLRTIQMNKQHQYQGVIDNQLQALHNANIMPNLNKEPSTLDALPAINDKNADINKRARGYLHVHCSICHDDSGGGNSRFQVRYNQTLDKTKLIKETPLHGNFGLKDGRLITPGDPFASVLYYRISKLGSGRMPHVGSKVVDPQGTELLHDWIRQLASTDSESHPDYRVTLKQLRQKNVKIPSLLNDTRSALMMARILAKETITTSLRQQIIQTAMKNDNANIRDLFERFVPEEQRVKRLGDRIRPEQILSLKGNSEKGRQYFFKDSASQCRSCHRIDNQGGTLGPDLSGIGKQYQRHEILESLLEPSRKMEDKYQTQVVFTDDGKVYSGILMEKTKETIVLNIFKEGRAEVVRIPVNRIEEMLTQSKSMMPEGQLRNLTAQQAADLLEYLTTLKSAKK